MSELVRKTKKYLELGLSVIPVKKDKAPALRSWKEYQFKKMPLNEVEKKFDRSSVQGVGIVTGNISDNLEVIDGDWKYDITGTLEDDFLGLLRDNIPEIYERLVIAKTVNNGHHIYYRCSEIAGNQKLATRPANKEELAKHNEGIKEYNRTNKDKKPKKEITDPFQLAKVLLETRGNGGYVVAPPTEGYEIIKNSLGNIPLISPEEREYLLGIAKYFHQAKEAKEVKKFPKTFPDEWKELKSPFEDFNERGDALEILINNGWTEVKTIGERVHILRAGETISKTSGNWHTGKRKLYLFSTSTALPSQEGISATDIFIELECSGDKSKASKMLYEKGYGERRPELKKSKSALKKKGKKPALEYIQNYIKDKNLVYNEVTHQVQKPCGQSVKDIDVNTYFVDLQLAGFKVSKDNIFSYITSHYIKRINPLRDYFNSLKGTHNNELGQLLNSLKIKDESKKIFIEKWLVSIVASAFGTPTELTLVLCGAQGNGKTEFFTRLFPKSIKDYFTTDKLDREKDSDILMTNKLVILDDEFSGKSKKDARKFKALTSQKVFSVRKPYARNSEDLKRLAVLCGASNTLDIINDNTGNRRIIPVDLISRNFNQYDAIDRDKLFLQLFQLYKNNGESSYRLTQFEMQYLKELSENYQSVNFEREMILSHFEKVDNKEDGIFLTATEVTNIIAENTKINVSYVKIGQELTQLGFIKAAKKVSGTSKRGYYLNRIYHQSA